VSIPSSTSWSCCHGRSPKTRLHPTASRIALPEYENSLLPIPTYPNIFAFTERGQIVIGCMGPVGAGAIAAEGRLAPAMLRKSSSNPPSHSFTDNGIILLFTKLRCIKSALSRNLGSPKDLPKFRASYT
jgi:hypothetical protein